MIVYSLLILTFAIAFWSLWLLLRYTRFSWAVSWPSITLSVALAVFIFLFGAWVFASVYVKNIFAILFEVIFVLSFYFKKVDRKLSQSALVKGIKLSAAFVFFLLSVLYYTGTAGAPYGTINLSVPFKKGGTYLVFQGGKGLPTNIFHFFGRRTLFAMDIIKLNDYGNRANTIFSTNLNDYCIFGDTIVSPCAGTIAQTENDNPDNIPPSRETGSTNLNYVLIETDSAYVLLGHLESGSVRVKAGDRVEVGQPLALAGNSGMSLEPHLHIQAHAKTLNNVPWYKQPQLLIKFDGKGYLLNETIKTGK